MSWKRESSILKVVSAIVLILTLMLASALGAEATGQELLRSKVYGFGNYGGNQAQRTPLKLDRLETVKSVASNNSHMLLLMENGDVYSWGVNHKGQLGLGDTQTRINPVRITGIGRAKSVGVGQNHSFIVLENGDLYGFGSNEFGQLGLGDREDRLRPTKIEELEKVKMVAGGQEHSMVLLEDGDLYTFGYSTNGQLGQGPEDEIVHLVPLKVMEDVESISAKTTNSMAVKKDGDVYTFGRNANGQLGYSTDRTFNETPTKVPGISGARQVVAGNGYSLVLLKNGDVYAFGRNNYGQLGLGDRRDRAMPTKISEISNVKMIGAGYSHSILVTDKDAVYTMGSGAGGRLGLGDFNSKDLPTRVSGLPEGEVLDITAGYSHTLVVVENPEKHYQNASSWAVIELDKAAGYGLITDSIRENMVKVITREEFCELAVRFYESMTGEVATYTEGVFTDTSNPEILKAYKLGIVKGVGGGRFAPDNLVSRQEISVMLFRTLDVSLPELKLNEIKLEPGDNFADQDDIANWAIKEIQHMNRLGIIRGIGGNRIDPLGNATREQGVLLTVRTLEEFR